MPKYTNNYNLTKPTNTELYDIEVFNENMDKIDNAYGENNPPPYPVTSVDGKTGAVDTGITYPQPNETYTDPTTGEEQLTGDYWIDGKPVYRRTVTGYIGASKTITTIGYIGPVAVVVSINGCIKSAGGPQAMPPNLYHTTNFMSNCWIEDSATGKVNAYYTDTGTVYAVFEYTKPD